MTATKREGGHTLGPWARDGHFTIVSPKALADVAIVQNSGDDEEDDANARLIAAAPDLLEALKSLLLTAYSGGLLVGEAHRMAEAAIAAATGAGHE